ncbi:pseudouridine synthase [Sphingomonas sp.]|jgi:23S rRNA pseudouridine2605 synthase|uniref:pseudouridine synthase n=1 Tax=Sphingomonas sp. TaxID=28214 RepID=UPI002E30D090|nr:pseudouridine synthase [Sphingomonas sp.]HEX4694165.1 pseudouridine synthase [Sphingomonas sp.]
MPSPKTAPANSGEQRIAKLLARAGVASRREVERMIAEGRVALNGVAIDTPATLLASLDGVTVDGNPVKAASAARLFIYHKPTGLLVTERDPGGRPTIYDRLSKTLPRVVPVGRLDLNTEGLLLLTTDGGLKRQLELPATGVERAYRARAYGNVTQAQLEELIEGVEIEGVRYGSIDANLERRTGANVWIELVLTEGKNREVRRVLEHLGLKVSRLIRTRYGPFVLGDLPVGAVGEVRAHDVESFRANPTRKDLPQPARQSSSPSSLAREGKGEGRPASAAQKTRRYRSKAPPGASSPRQRSPSPRPAPGKDSPRLSLDRAGRDRPDAPARREGEGRKTARPGKPAKPPRQRADGTLATRSSGTRSDRARTHREASGRDTPSGPSGPARGPAGGRGKPSGRPPRKRP